MKNYTYHFEIKDLLTQFAAAFDDVVIKRYNKNRVAEQSISVRYVLAPKERVMYDIVNKAHNLTLPVIAMNVASISRDNNRVFNKLDRIYNYIDEKSSTNMRMPVPINIEVSVSILSRYMQDMDQILSNFIPHTNPYFIISYKEPSITQEAVEIRTDVNWNGSINMSSPTDITFSDKFRIIADTSFTIKGWLFRDTNETTPPIITISYNGINAPRNFNFESLDDAKNYKTVTDTLTANTAFNSLSGAPRISNLFLFTGGSYLRLPPETTITGTVSGTGDKYGPGGTYGRGSTLGTSYGPGGLYTETAIRSRDSNPNYNYGTINLRKPGGYSSGQGDLESGGNYLIGGNNLLQTRRVMLSSASREEFVSLLFEDILYNSPLSRYFTSFTTNTDNVTALNAFLQTPDSSLLTNLSSVSSFYTLVNTYDKFSDVDVFSSSLSTIPGTSDLLNMYPAPADSLYSSISSFSINGEQVSGYELPLQRYTLLTDGVMLTNIPICNIASGFDIVVINNAGWASTNDILT